MKQKTIFFGASAYVLPVINFLQENYNLTLVITTETNPHDAVISYCTTNNIPFLSIKKIDSETIETIKRSEASFAILADFRLLIKQHIIDLFPQGIINIHPSLLPEYRGPTPGLTALLQGKEKTGVSLMLLDKDLDHGLILAQEEEQILPTDTSPTLYTRLFAKGTELLKKNLSLYLEGKLTPKEQDHNRATYTDFLTRESGFRSLGTLENMTPQEIDQTIRAYFPWPGLWTKIELNGKEKIVKFLPDIMIQVEGKKPQTQKDFLNGYPQMKELLGKILKS